MVRKIVLGAIAVFLVDLTFTLGGSAPGSGVNRVFAPMQWWFTLIVESVVDGGLRT